MLSDQTGIDLQTGVPTEVSGATTKPAIGLDLTDRTADSETLINTVTELQQYNSHVIVTVDATETQFLSRLHSLDITVVEITDTAHADPEQGLIIAAKDLGLPGVLVHPALEECADIQYHTSCEEFRTANQYAIQAHIADDKTDATVIAGLTTAPQDNHSEQLVRAASDYVDDVLIVDDGTRDATPQVLHDTDATVIDYDPNDGTATPLQRLLQHVERHFSNFDAFVLLSESDQVAPAAIPTLVNPVSEEDADIVIGRRATTDDQSDTQDVRPIGQRLRDSFTMGSPEQRDAALQPGVQALSADAVSQLQAHAGNVESAAGLIDVAIRANLTVRERELQRTTEADVDAAGESVSGSESSEPTGTQQSKTEGRSSKDERVAASRQTETRRRPAETDGTATDRPAVGFVVTPGVESDAVAGAVLRASNAGHDVLVGAVGGTDTEATAFARTLGADVIDIEARRDRDEGPRDVLVDTAKQAGYPGLLWQTEAGQRIDFERSSEALAGKRGYCEAAVEQPSVTPEPSVLVAIPAYNEAETIAEVVEGAQPYADEVLVVDDGSEDDTAARAQEAGATLIEHESNRGYGAALQTTFREADRSEAGHLVVLDGDGQHDPADIPAFVQAQRERDAEVVTGSRFGAETETDLPLYRRFGLGIVNLTTNLSMGAVRSSSRLRDTQCGFRTYNRQAIQALANEASIGSHMGASTDILHFVRANDYDVVEVPTTVDYEVDGASTHNPVRHGLTLIMNLVRTIEKDRPISAIGVPGFVSALVGVGFGYWTFSQYLASGVFPLGLAVTSTLFTLVGVFACFTAIILHSLSTHFSER